MGGAWNMTIEYKDSKRIITSPSSATSVQGYSQLNAGTNGWNIASGALDGERLSLQIVSGSSIIADPIKEIKMKLSKNSSPTDTFYVRVRNSSDTILAEASMDSSTISASLTEYTFTLNTGVILAQGDRINAEYTGSSGSGNVSCGVNNATEPSTVNCQKYDGSSYSDIDRTPDWQFDSSPSTTISILQDKPTDVQDNSILVEKDTAKRYWSTSAPTFEDDFTSDKGWAESGTEFTIDTSTNHRIDFALKRDGADHEVYKDLTSVSDTAWVLRMHLNFTGNTNADSYDSQTFFGLSSTNGAYSGTQDAIGLEIRWGIDDDYKTGSANGSLLPFDNTSTFSTAFTSTDEYWVEIIRESETSFTIELFSDSTYTTSVEKVTETTSSGVSGLQYIVGKMRSSSSRAEIQNGYLDDIEFYNGVTTATPITTWTPSYPDDISNLYAWYDANDSTTITKSSDRVSAWTNKEGTSVRDLNQGTSGSQPLWVSADKNGKDVIDFASSRYILTDANLTSVSSATTTFIVTQIPASSVNINHSMSNRNNTTWHPLYKEDNNSIRVSNTSGGAYVIDNPPSLESWTYATIIANGTSGFVRTNGVLETTVPTSPTGSANAFVGLSVGRYESIAGSYWNEKIAEIIIYDRLLTTSEIEGVEAYLKVKWGL
jgi:hypothetical protein